MQEDKLIHKWNASTKTWWKCENNKHAAWNKSYDDDDDNYDKITVKLQNIIRISRVPQKIQLHINNGVKYDANNSSSTLRNHLITYY